MIGSETAKGHLALLLFSFFVAGTYSLGQSAAPFIDATALMALRFLISAILMGLIVSVSYTSRQRQIQNTWRYLLLGTVFAVYFVTLFEALKLTDAVSTGAMFTLTPFITAGFAWVLLRQATLPWVIFSLSIAAAGAVWVVFRGDWGSLIAFDVGKGEQIFFIGVVAHALYVPLARLLDRGEPVLVFTFGVLAGGSIPLLIISYPQLLAIDWGAIPNIVWIALGYMVVFATLITFVLLQYGNQRLPGAKVMAYTYLVPTWVIVWEAMLGHGVIEPELIPGIAMTLLAMLLLIM